MTLQIPRDPIGRLSDAWRTCVGTGRLDLALRHDYQESLRLIQEEIGFRHIRGHGLFSDGVGIRRPYQYAGAERVHHVFTYLDQIVDAYLGLGVRPFLELGFMPSSLASGEQTVFWWRGNVTPPRDEQEWVRLVTSTLSHLIDRYGAGEVRHWPIEVWNEPNLTSFWLGADEKAYHRLYTITARAIKDVDAELQVGGPAISPGSDDWLRRFADHVSEHEVPVDFVSKHAYTSGPAQHVPFGTHQTLRPARNLLEQFASPRRLLSGTALSGLPVHITEFSSSYRPDNIVHDTALQAAYLAPVVAAGGDLVDSFSYWTFSDVFEEEGIPAALFHGGFGMLAHRQLRKPVHHLYTFMARLGPDVLARGEDHLVTRDATGRVCVLAWAPVDVTGREPVDRHELRLSVPVGGGAAVPVGGGPAAAAGGGPEVSAVFVLRRSVNEQDGNAYSAWNELGRPPSPTARELDLLHEAAQPARHHQQLPVERGRTELPLTLARHEVTLVELTPVVDHTPPWWDGSRLLGETPAPGVVPGEGTR